MEIIGATFSAFIICLVVRSLLTNTNDNEDDDDATMMTFLSKFVDEVNVQDLLQIRT